jgi:hypothetical protein
MADFSRDNSNPIFFVLGRVFQALLFNPGEGGRADASPYRRHVRLVNSQVRQDVHSRFALTAPAATGCE